MPQRLVQLIRGYFMSKLTINVKRSKPNGDSKERAAT